MPQKHIPNKHYIFAADPIRHKIWEPCIYLQYSRFLFRHFHVRSVVCMLEAVRCYFRWPCGLSSGSTAAHLWELRLQIPPMHGCLSLMNVVCCQVEVCATGRSFLQRSSTKCGVAECDLETSTTRRHRASRGVETQKKIRSYFRMVMWSPVLRWSCRTTAPFLLMIRRFRRYAPKVVKIYLKKRSKGCSWIQKGHGGTISLYLLMQPNKTERNLLFPCQLMGL